MLSAQETGSSRGDEQKGGNSARHAVTISGMRVMCDFMARVLFLGGQRVCWSRVR